MGRAEDARGTEAGDGRRVASVATAQNREEERRRLTGGPGGKILFISFFFLGCDNPCNDPARDNG